MANSSLIKEQAGEESTGPTGDKVNKYAAPWLIINKSCAIASGAITEIHQMCTSYRKLVTYSITVLSLTSRAVTNVREHSLLYLLA